MEQLEIHLHKVTLAKICGRCKHGNFSNDHYWKKRRLKEGYCTLMNNRPIHQNCICSGWQRGKKSFDILAKQYVDKD
jgi:hypothetical protein